MSTNPYNPPEAETAVPAPVQEAGAGGYRNYSEVPVHRRQWFFWVMYFTLQPVAIVLLILGDIYYVKKGRVTSFGVANRIVAGIIAVVFLYNLATSIFGMTIGVSP